MEQDVNDATTQKNEIRGQDVRWNPGLLDCEAHAYLSCLPRAVTARAEGPMRILGHSSFLPSVRRRIEEPASIALLFHHYITEVK